MPTSIRRDETLTRREFTVESLMALFAGITISVSCGGDNDPPTGPSAPGDRTGSISANHGHVATVTRIQLDAGNAIVLSIQGTAEHPHTVDLTAGEVAQIRNGQRVSKSSSSDPSATFGTHLHTVTFN